MVNPPVGGRSTRKKRKLLKKSSLDNSNNIQIRGNNNVSKAQVLSRRALEGLRGSFRRHSRAEATRADGALR